MLQIPVQTTEDLTVLASVSSLFIRDSHLPCSPLLPSNPVCLPALHCWIRSGSILLTHPDLPTVSFRVNPANSSWFTNRSAIRLLFRTYPEISLIVHSASIYRWNCWNCLDESKRISIICCMFDEDQTLVRSSVTSFTSFICISFAERSLNA